MTQIARPTTFGFISGMLSDQIEGRVDLEKYVLGLRDSLNFQISHLGGAYKRRGFRNVSSAYDTGSANITARRIISFDFNSTEGQSYCIELSFNASNNTTYLRFFRQGGLVLSGGAEYVVSTTFIPTAASMLRMNFIQSTDRIYFADSAFKPFSLARYGDADWKFEALTFTTNASYPLPWGENDYPRKIMFYEDRLLFASTPTAPTTLWMSRTSRYTDFQVNTASASLVPLATDSIWIRMGGGKLNPIAWVSDRRNLLVGTNDAEFSFSGGSGNEPLTPENTGYQREGVYGSANITPLPLEDAVMFISRSRKKVHEITLDVYVNTFKVTQLNILCPEIIESGVKTMAQTEEPHNVIWFLLDDGTLAACTYVREHSIVAWHRHVMGNGGKILDITSTPTETGSTLWALVKYPRSSLEGSIRVECISDSDKPEYLDGYVSGTASTAGVISGLAGIMDGDTVDLVVDGSFKETTVVNTDGSISHSRIKAGSEVIVGYRYVASLVPMPIGFVSNNSTTEGAQKGVNNMSLKLWNTVGGRVRMVYPKSSKGLTTGPWAEAETFPFGAILDEPPEPRSYDWKSNPQGIFMGDSVTFEFNHDIPYPCNILSVTYDLIVGGINNGR